MPARGELCQLQAQGLKAFEAELVRNGPRVRRCRFERERLDLLFATLNSYLGQHRECVARKERSAFRGSLQLTPTAGIPGFHFNASGLRLLCRCYRPPTEADRASKRVRHYRRQFPEAVSKAPGREVLRILRPRLALAQAALDRANAKECARRALRISGGCAAGVSAGCSRRALGHSGLVGEHRVFCTAVRRARRRVCRRRSDVRAGIPHVARHALGAGPVGATAIEELS